MDSATKCIIFLLNPCLLFISQISIQSLLTTLILFNPFTVILSIEALHYWSTPRSGNYIILNIETNNLDDVRPSQPDNQNTQQQPSNSSNNNNNINYCNYYQRDVYYKLWLLSVHLTSLAVFQYYLVSSLQISISESSTLLLCYMILLIALIDLKYNKQQQQQQHPQQHETTYNTATRHIQTLCNILHVAILAQLAYLNLTFSCASQPLSSSWFGTKLLIPSDCSYVEENQVARMSMYCGINSGQILFCQLALELAGLFTPRGRRNNSILNSIKVPGRA